MDAAVGAVYECCSVEAVDGCCSGSSGRLRVRAEAVVQLWCSYEAAVAQKSGF